MRTFRAKVRTANHTFQEGVYEAESAEALRTMLEGIAPQWRDGPAVEIVIEEAPHPGIVKLTEELLEASKPHWPEERPPTKDDWTEEHLPK